MWMKQSLNVLFAVRLPYRHRGSLSGKWLGCYHHKFALLGSVMKTKKVLYIVSNIFSHHIAHKFLPQSFDFDHFITHIYPSLYTPLSPFTTLHFTALPFTSLHFTSLHFYTRLDDFHFTSLYFTSLHYTFQ